MDSCDALPTALVKLYLKHGNGGTEASIKKSSLENERSSLSSVSRNHELLDLIRFAVRHELSDTLDEALVFRRNSMATKLTTGMTHELSRQFLLTHFSELIAYIVEVCAPYGDGTRSHIVAHAGSDSPRNQCISCAIEVDPARLPDQASSATGPTDSLLLEQQAKLSAVVVRTLDAICSALPCLPAPLKPALSCARQ